MSQLGTPSPRLLECWEMDVINVSVVCRVQIWKGNLGKAKPKTVKREVVSFPLFCPSHLPNTKGNPRRTSHIRLWKKEFQVCRGSPLTARGNKARRGLLLSRSVKCVAQCTLILATSEQWPNEGSGLHAAGGWMLWEAALSSGRWMVCKQVLPVLSHVVHRKSR